MTLWIWFLSLLLISVCLRQYSTLLNTSKSTNKSVSNHSKHTNGKYLNKKESVDEFQKWYIIIFILSRLSDWVLGPYVYILYDSYNYSEFDKAILFIFGYLTSGIFGIFIGSIADRFGRKLICILFCILFSLSSIIITHFGFNFYNLLFGRFLSGISTSILHSVFETWMITHHNTNHYTKNKLNQTFEMSNQLNSILAIFAGIIGSSSIAIYKMYHIFESVAQCVAAFHFSCFILLITMILIIIKWKENYGFNGEKKHEIRLSLMGTIKHSLNLIFCDKRILCIGIIQSGFESSLYIFVFMWTQYLDAVYVDDTSNTFDNGIVFALMMMACYIGTCIVTIIRLKLDNNNLIQCIELSVICIICGISFILIGFVNSFNSRLLIFVIYEICVGFYRPTLSSLRSKCVPHQYMATIINIFRVPLNIIVVVVLINIHRFGDYVFIIACVLNFVCCVVTYKLIQIL